MCIRDSLIVRNTKSWSNTELRKKCKSQEYGGNIGTDGEGTTCLLYTSLRTQFLSFSLPLQGVPA